jgi:hypothetical protein
MKIGLNVGEGKLKVAISPYTSEMVAMTIFDILA